MSATSGYDFMILSRLINMGPKHRGGPKKKESQIMGNLYFDLEGGSKVMMSGSLSKNASLHPKKRRKYDCAPPCVKF